LKLAPILAQYLSTNKRLALPGIGEFLSVPSAHVELSKHAKLPVDDISFTNNPATKGDDDLIKFISEKTGKMKALAISDLESYLELMQQFLNIGKPFQLEGIGTLVKLKPGIYEFTSGHVLTEKITEPSVKELATTSTTDDSFSGYKTYPRHSTAGVTFKKTFVAFLLFGGIGLAVWGGYTLYEKNKIGSRTEETHEKAVVPVADTTTAPIQKTVAVKNDTVVSEKHKVSVTPGYKFVFETTLNKKRAIKRFNFLKTINSDIHLETGTDSSSFNITVNMNIPASDTTRVKDSLNSWYYGKKDMLVKIASPNVTANVP
jgi:hypothetical protein